MAVTDDAILRIREMILSQELAPGDRLPPEKELSAALGLSRSSLREAVKALEVVNVLDVRRGDGTYVTDLGTNMVRDAVSFMIELHQDSSAESVLEVRRVLEGAAAGFAANRMTDEELAALRRTMADMRASSIEHLVEHDMEFHSLIANGSGNDYLCSLLEGMASSTVRVRVWRALSDQGAVQRTLEEHESILSALEARDEQLAQATAIAHIAGVQRWLHQARVPAEGPLAGANSATGDAGLKDTAVADPGSPLAAKPEGTDTLAAN